MREATPHDGSAPRGGRGATSLRPRPRRGRDRALSEEAGDVALVERAAAGDEAAYALIYQRHVGVVTRVVASRLGRQGDPDDVVQEVFTSAWRSLGRLRDATQLRPWLLQIARRSAIDHGRRFRRAPAEEDAEDRLDGLADPGPAPDELAELSELARRVTVGITGLSRRDATAIALATHLGLGPADIAATLGVSEGNARVILHRARGRLRAALSAERA